MSPAPIQSAIPLRSECERGPILVVLFGNIFSDQAKREEMCRVADARSRFVLNEDKNFWPTYVLLSRVADDIFGNSGTVTDIYDIAAVARQCGWESLMILDELSWRQHDKLTTNYEDPTLSATVINPVCATSGSVLSPRSTFYMRRLPLVMAMEECYLSEPQEPKDWSQAAQRADDHSFQLHQRTGFYLYCPWEPIFSRDNLAELQEQALCARPLLPQELKNHIMAHLQPHEPTCLQELIDTSRFMIESATLIQPLVSLTDHESLAVCEAIKGQLPGHSVRMGRWKRASSANRRDLSRILRHFDDGDHAIIFILNRPSDQTGLQVALYSRPSPSMEGFRFEVFHRLPLEFLKDAISGSRPLVVKCKSAQWDKEKEVYMDPLWSFPHSLPPWYKTMPVVEIPRNPDQSWAMPNYPSHEKHLVFYLTRALSDSQQRAIQAVVEADDISGYEYDFIPWSNDTDGGPEDILRIIKMVETSSAKGYGIHDDGFIVFIDRRSAIDHRVIVFDWEFVQDHGRSGIVYARLGSDIDNFLTNMSIANMGMIDWFDDRELEFVRDPDYSGPLEDDRENADE